MTLWTLTDLRSGWRRWISTILEKIKIKKQKVSSLTKSPIVTNDPILESLRPPESPPPQPEPPTPELPQQTSSPSPPSIAIAGQSPTPSPPIESPSQSETRSEPHDEPQALPPPDAEQDVKAAVSREFRRRLSQDYHRLLKARMSFDKLVTPKGSLPERPKRERADPRPKRAPKPAPEETEAIPPIDPNERIISAHYDDNPDNPEVLIEESEIWGQYNFRDTILDQLERYWFYLDRMRKHDADAFGFYQKVGMHMVPYVSIGAIGKITKEDRKMTAEEVDKYKEEIKLPPAFKIYRPGFGCVAFGSNPKIESWERDLGDKSHFPRFLYYTKYKGPPPMVQMISGGDIYALTIWYDDYRNPKKKWGVPNTFPVFISRDGERIQLLKVRETRLNPVRRKIKRQGRWDDFLIPKRGFYIPRSYELWADSYGLDAETHLTHMFCYAARIQESAQLGDIRVSVHKGDLTAIFSVSSRRMAYFFQDRDIQLTEGGLRRPLFHIVKPHIRKDGIAVKMHYRGERRFTWAGYEVEISVPGKDHFIQHEMNIGAWDEDALDKKVEAITLPELGEKIVEMMNQGIGGLAPPRR